jgi:predicted nuclease of predicted toxin-antitoxin system
VLILAYEDIDYPIIKNLRSQGFMIVSILEETPSISDASVLEVALKLNAIVLTNDKDFGDLVIRQKLPHRGIILLRLSNKDLTEITKIITDVLQNYTDKLPNLFTVVRDKSVKFRNS